MNVLQLKKQTAKQLFNNKQFTECKQLLLEIVGEGDGHFKLYMRLGDVCTELKEYQNAQKYYQKSISENPTYPLVYCRFGILLSEYLNENNFAERMFERAVELDPKNSDLCWFNFGKLMYKLSNFKKAKKCFSKCTKERACVHYHFAKVLLSNSDQNSIQTAKLKLEKATIIKPNNTTYHHEYALCLQRLKETNSANAQFLIALQLSNQENIQILYDYAAFLSVHFNNNQQAIKYLKIAADLDKNDDFPLVKSLCLELQSKCESITKKVEIEYDECIKLIIYTFNETLTYWNMNAILMNELQSMTTLDLIVNIFGGTDRINRLQMHFQRILSSQNNIKLAIILLNNNNNNSEMVIYVLKKVNLYKYFADADIIGSDNKSFTSQQHIQSLSNKYKLNIAKEILFIESVAENIKLTKNKCKTYHIISTQVLNGLSLQHMDQIETIIGVAISGDTAFCDASLDETEAYDLKRSNKLIYGAIKTEIIKASVNSICSLPVIKYIHEHMQNDADKDKFLYFAHKYKIIRGGTLKYYCWTSANILPKLMKLSPSDSELFSRYATSLAFLQHHDAADHYFKIAIKQSHSAVNYHQYAYFLLDQKKYAEAEPYFVKAIQSSHIHFYSRSCLGYARTLEHLHQYNKAEIYYKEAVKCKYQMGKMQYFYGIFLYNQRRYNEARIQFEIAVNYYPNSATNHHWLSKTLRQLQDSDTQRYEMEKKQRKIYESKGTCTAQQCVHKIRHLYTNPCFRFSEVIDASKMERYRQEMQIIAENEPIFNLGQMHPLYAHYFNRHFKSIYQGKIKNVVLYFNDLFKLRWNAKTNLTYVISKIYSHEARRTTNFNGNNQFKNATNYQKVVETLGNTQSVMVCAHYEIEFDRFWFDELGIVTDKFNKYYDTFLENKMNDIRCILFDDDIESKLQHIIKVDSSQDLQLIMTNVRELKKENSGFRKILKTKNLNTYYPMFTGNAIFTMKALKYHIESEKDIKEMIESYITFEFHAKDILISLIWGIVNTE